MSQLFGTVQLCEIETRMGTKLLESHIKAAVTIAEQNFGDYANKRA